MSDLAWEFEEPEPVEASHLLKVRCAGCGASRAALAAPGQEAGARCTACFGSSPGATLEAAGARAYTPGRTEVALRPAPWPGGLDPHPAPERSSRDETPGGTPTPTPVQKLAQRASEAGAQAIVQYARGHGVHGSTGRPTAVRDSWAVRIVNGAGRAAAVYAGGSWGSVWIVDAAGWHRVGVTDLAVWLAERGAVEPLWFEHIAALLENRELASKKGGPCPGDLRCLLLWRWLLGVLVKPELVPWPWDRLVKHEHRANGDIKPRTVKKAKSSEAL